MEQREFTRIGRHLAVTMSLPGQTIVGETRDVAVKGCFVATDVRLATGTRLHCSVWLGEPGGEFSIEAQAEVARSTEDGLALSFVELIGLESLSHLHALIRYNAGDELETVEQEFSSHLGLHRRQPEPPDSPPNES